MKQITFTEKEAKKLHILKEIAEWKLAQKDWALELDISTRQMRRLQRDFELLWDESVKHWLKGKHWNRPHIDTSMIIDIAKQDEFRDFKPTLLTEYVEENYGIKTSSETVRKALIKEHLREVRSKKSHTYRQTRERRSVFGEMVQFDWSYHKRFEERDPEEYCLLLGVDDATWDNMFWKLCKNEWFECIAWYWIDYILKFWIPLSIYLDKFSSYKVNHPRAVYDKNMITEFERIMNKLGCKLIFANSPQAKWRVERRNHLRQDRLIKELRIKKIADIRIANLYISEFFVPKLNEKFSVDSRIEWDVHIPYKGTRGELEIVFSKIVMRSVWQDYVIQYKNRFFQTIPWNYALYPKKRVEVRETYKWEILIKIWEKIVNFTEVKESTVKIQRWKYRNEIRKTKEAKQRIDLENRLKARHEASKKRQILQKPLDLL